MIPLFITPMSLSSRSAIGVQTKLMLEHFPDWRHLYWDARDFDTSDPRSASAESLLFTHFTLLKHEPPRLLGRVLSGAGLSWWNNNELRTHYAKRIAGRLRNEIDAVYVAPCSVRDSRRTRSLLAAMKKPFLLHLWDLLDEHQLSDEAFQWLLKRATMVLCVSEPLVDWIAPHRPDASILRFCRKPARHSAVPPTAGTLRIALIGNCRRYPEGLNLLDEALGMMSKAVTNVELLYVGTAEHVKSWSSPAAKRVKVTGFLASDDDRDKELAKCNVGFIPGPLANPASNLLSRFSIPSRLLDYAATRLPIIATVHASSATALFLRNMGLDHSILGSNAKEIADRLTALCDQDLWLSESHFSSRAFHLSSADFGQLKHWLESAAKASSPAC